MWGSRTRARKAGFFSLDCCCLTARIADVGELVVFWGVDDVYSFCRSVESYDEAESEYRWTSEFDRF